MKATKKPKEPVRLREKPIANGNISLYLDIYVNGRRSYEFLKLYIVPENSRSDKEANARTLSLANAIKSQRIVELQNGRFGFESAADNILFEDYIKSVMKEKDGGAIRTSLQQVLNTVRQYDRRKNLTLSQIDQEWVKGYVAFLSRLKKRNGEDLRPNSRQLYYTTLKTLLRRAYNDNLISDFPAKGIHGIKKEEVRRNYLTIEEIGLLAKTPCRNDTVKRAFLFSCLTGLRMSDVKALRWEDISMQGKYHRIMFRQQKTQGQEYLDVSQQAIELLGKRGSGLVFGPMPAIITNTLKTWTKAAGINKHITFHCARHTFAVMMLDLDTDLYTVSKLLGHREIRTTQVYAKVLDKNKQAAIDRIPSILS